MQNYILEDVDTFVANLVKEEGRDGKICIENWRERFVVPVINGIWRISTGEVLQHNDDKLSKLIPHVSKYIFVKLFYFLN